jgi:hypothetical protein
VYLIQHYVIIELVMTDGRSKVYLLQPCDHTHTPLDLPPVIFIIQGYIEYTFDLPPVITNFIIQSGVLDITLYDKVCDDYYCTVILFLMLFICHV